MGLLTFRKKSQKSKDVRASTFTVAPSSSITRLAAPELEPEAPDTRVLASLAECASSPSTAVEIEYQPPIHPRGSTSLRTQSHRASMASTASGVSSAPEGNAAPDSSAESAQCTTQDLPGDKQWSPETIEEDEEPSGMFTHAWTGSSEREEFDLSQLAAMVGADTDSPFGFQKVGNQVETRQARPVMGEVDEGDFYVPAFGIKNRNGGVQVER